MTDAAEAVKDAVEMMEQHGAYLRSIDTDGLLVFEIVEGETQ